MTTDPLSAEEIAELAARVLPLAGTLDSGDDGDIWRAVGVETVEAGCCEQPLPNGECCGQAIPVQGFELQQFELSKQDAADLIALANAFPRLLSTIEALTAEKAEARAKAFEEAAGVAERQGRNTKFGPCDTYHNGERAGYNIATAIRALSQEGKSNG
jgi:hypothetical protein